MRRPVGGSPRLSDVDVADVRPDVETERAARLDVERCSRTTFEKPKWRYFDDESTTFNFFRKTR